MAEKDPGFRDFFRGKLPITDVPQLRNLVRHYKEDKELQPEWFFSMSLLGYYDAMHGGLNVTAGHILYRLSDFIELREREKMVIYPSQTGSIILSHGYEGSFFDFCESDRWDSLEDWRELWEKNNPFIPEYPVPQERMLQSGIDS